EKERTKEEEGRCREGDLGKERAGLAWQSTGLDSCVPVCVCVCVCECVCVCVCVCVRESECVRHRSALQRALRSPSHSEPPGWLQVCSSRSHATSSDWHTHTHTHTPRSEEHTSALQSHLNLVCRP